MTLVSEPIRCLKAFEDVFLCPYALPLHGDILLACVKCSEVCWAVKLWVMIPADFSVECERGLFTDCAITPFKPSLTLGGSGHPSLPNQVPGTEIKITEGDALCLDK